MAAAPHHPCDQTYALRLHAPPDAPQAVRGRIEHVLSGECRDFESAPALLAALIALQARVTAARMAHR